MLKNYFKVAWRNLIQNRVYSAVNIFGLAAGMAVALLIGLWAHEHYSYNVFLKDYQQVYRVKRNFDSNGDTLTFNTISLKLVEALRHDVPEIEHVVESDWMGTHSLMAGEKKIYVRGGQSGDEFLKVFQYPLIKGNPTVAMSDPYSILLTESTAKALFGDTDPMDKMIRFDNKDNLKVTGIMRDLPANSTLKFEWLVPFSYMDATNPRIKTNRTASFGNNGYQAFVKLKPGVSQAQAEQKIRNIEHTETQNINAMKSYVILQPLRDWHLRNEYKNGHVSGGFIKYVNMFVVIGVLVLLIACINFVNLTTARSEKRAREVGIRKSIGSGRRQLIVQFLGEALLFAFISLALALALVELALPSFNALTGSIVHVPLYNPGFWAIAIACTALTALIAGSRPAFYLSSFRPVAVLKGLTVRGRTSTFSRKVLVILQFTCSIALIVSTIIIYQQINYAKDRPTGYDVNRLLVSTTNNEVSKNYRAFKNDVLRQGIVTSMTQATSPATDIYWHSDLDNWPGKVGNETVELGVIDAADDYFRTMGMKIKEGRDFTDVNDTLSVVLNAAAVQRLHMHDPVGQLVRFQGTKFTIIGVANDALMVSPFSPADPTLFFCDANPKGSLIYRLSPTISTEDAIARLTAAFNKYNPAYPFNYSFADVDYGEKFSLESLVGQLAGLFAGLAIIISCLGLFGLIAYVAERRTKEIGVRKVLGASVPQIWLLLSKDFIVLVLISCIIASPVALYFLDDWLHQYEYRIKIGPAAFLLAALAAIFITVATISFQAVKAALANPVKSLRTE